jgi:signal transduction histidine kinase
MAELTYMNRTASAGLLSASLAHEINQPLTGIVTRANAGMRRLAAETPDIEKAHAALANIVEAGHRTAEIVTNVKAMFRKDAVEKLSIDTNKVIRSVSALTYMDMRKHSIANKIVLDDNLPPVPGNETQLQQVILNLVMNAIEAMSSSELRVLSIRSELGPTRRVLISIEDTGSGIDPEQMDRIFDPLFTTKKRGMGMGLSICHSIIESHGGKIWASPAVPRGKHFHVELPAMSETEGIGTKAA